MSFALHNTMMVQAVKNRPNIESQNARGQILIVEDDPSLVKFWQRWFHENKQFECTIFNHPSLAMNWLKNNTPTLLITDLSMPGMDGTTLIRRVLNQNAETRIILTTGFVPEPNDFDKLGTHIHLVPKPYTNLGHITSLIQLILDNSLEPAAERISVWNI